MAFLSTTHFANRASLFQDGKLVGSYHNNPFMNSGTLLDSSGRYSGSVIEGPDGQVNKIDANGKFDGFSRETINGREHYDGSFSLVKRTVDTPTGTMSFDGKGQLLDNIMGHDTTDKITDMLINHR